MAEQLNVPVILGTAREGRRSEAVAKFVLSQALAYGFSGELIDVAEHAASRTDRTESSPVKLALQPAMAVADGFIIVTPEYNHGYPGELKIFMDTFYAEWRRKPVALVGVSSGRMGGVRAVEQLRQVLVELGAVPVREAMYFPLIEQAFNPDGSPVDGGYVERAAKMCVEVAWWGSTLRAARAAV